MNGMLITELLSAITGVRSILIRFSQIYFESSSLPEAPSLSGSKTENLNTGQNRAFINKLVHL